MEILEVEQRSDLWKMLKIGRFTASEFHKLMTDPRSKTDKESGNLSESAKTYVMDKVAEGLTGVSNEIDTFATRWGIENEPIAKELYSEVFGVKVREVGFCRYDEYVGCSPDGLVGSDGGLEIKCPYNSSKHIEYLLLNDVESFKKKCTEYYWQIQGCLMVTGREWWDFVSFDRRFKGVLKFKQLRIYPNTDDIELLKSRLNKAIEYKKSIEDMINSN